MVKLLYIFHMFLHRRAVPTVPDRDFADDKKTVFFQDIAQVTGII